MPGAADDALLAEIDALVQITRMHCSDCTEERNFGNAVADHLEGGHHVLYLNQFASTSLIAELWRLTQLADVWGFTSTSFPHGGMATDSSGRLALRCLEAIEYEGSSKHSSIGYHNDGDTYLTVMVMLSTADEFEGGAFEARRRLRPGDEKLCFEQHTANRGDVMVWRGWDEHRVAPILRGRRRVLVAEWRCCDANDDSSPSERRPDDSVEGFASALRLDDSSAMLHFAFANFLYNERLSNGDFTYNDRMQQEWRAALARDDSMCVAYDGLSLVAAAEGRKASERRHTTDRDSCIAAVRRIYRGDPLLESDLVLR